MITSQMLVTCEYLESWLMHLCHHKSAISFKTKQQNSFSLATRYRLFHPTTGKIIISRDVIFAEHAAQPLTDCSKEPVLDQPNVL